MYRCESCGQVVAPGTPAAKQVVQTREREYPTRSDNGSRPQKTKGRRGRRAGDPGGTGCEIVREQIVCPACAETDDEAN